MHNISSVSDFNLWAFSYIFYEGCFYIVIIVVPTYGVFAWYHVIKYKFKA